MADGTFDMDNASLGLKMALFLSTSNANTLSVGTGVYGDLTNEHANGTSQGCTCGERVSSAIRAVGGDQLQVASRSNINQRTVENVGAITCGVNDE